MQISTYLMTTTQLKALNNYLRLFSFCAFSHTVRLADGWVGGCRMGVVNCQELLLMMMASIAALIAGARGMIASAIIWSEERLLRWGGVVVELLLLCRLLGIPP